jgi:hypothetical protein
MRLTPVLHFSPIGSCSIPVDRHSAPFLAVGGFYVKELWHKIKHGAQVVGDFQARLILTILYVLLVLPTGMFVKLGGDLLELRHPDKTKSYWKPRPSEDDSLRPARRQG